MSNVIYWGDTLSTGRQVLKVLRDGATTPLALRLDLRNHSPDGFNWGYGGSGPSQLALALLADVVGEQAALAWYQDYKFKVVANLAGDKWEISAQQILEWCYAHVEADVEAARRFATYYLCKLEGNYLEDEDGLLLGTKIETAGPEQSGGSAPRTSGDRPPGYDGAG
jgi:hypothetical protein